MLDSGSGAHPQTWRPSKDAPPTDLWECAGGAIRTEGEIRKALAPRASRHSVANRNPEVDALAHFQKPAVGTGHARHESRRGNGADRNRNAGRNIGARA